MAGSSLGVPMYFKSHSLAAYMNILRRNLECYLHH